MDRFPQGLPELVLVDGHPPGEAGDQVPAPKVHIGRRRSLPDRADLDLHLLRLEGPDKKIILFPAVLDKGFVQAAASLAEETAESNLSLGEHCRFRGSCPHIHHQAAFGLPDRDSGSQGCRQRGFQQVSFPGSRFHGCIQHRPALHAVYPAGHRKHQPGPEQRPFPQSLTEKSPEHLPGQVEIGDDPVLEGPDHLDSLRGPAQHLPGLLAQGQDFLPAPVQGHGGGFIQYDSLVPEADPGMVRTQVHSQIRGKRPQ